MVCPTVLLNCTAFALSIEAVFYECMDLVTTLWKYFKLALKMEIGVFIGMLEGVCWKG